MKSWNQRNNPEIQQHSSQVKLDLMFLTAPPCWPRLKILINYWKEGYKIGIRIPLSLSHALCLVRTLSHTNISNVSVNMRKCRHHFSNHYCAASQSCCVWRYTNTENHLCTRTQCIVISMYFAESLALLLLKDPLDILNQLPR